MKVFEIFYKNILLTKIVIALLLVSTTMSCSKDDEPAKEEVLKSSDKEVLSFLAANNLILSSGVDTRVSFSSICN